MKYFKEKENELSGLSKEMEILNKKVNLISYHIIRFNN